jgi:hypothetical protein
MCFMKNLEMWSSLLRYSKQITYSFKLVIQHNHSYVPGSFSSRGRNVGKFNPLSTVGQVRANLTSSYLCNIRLYSVNIREVTKSTKEPRGEENS